MDESISSKERIKKKREFSFLYKNGNRYTGKHFRIIYLANEYKHSRLAAVAGKRIGSAVKRNKAKRWIRDLFRRNKGLLKRSTDLIIIARESIFNASWKILEKDYTKAIKHINQKSLMQ
ncbi:MAG: ribonuclease P protein component [Candidatus Aminicenantes bacterium]|nr:ribonuclease P protein component [Candidatus Aminicenantes bacterium]